MPMKLPETLLTGSEHSEVYQVVGDAGRGPFLIVCDHASNRVPAMLKDLGLTADSLATHIGWDIGAFDVAERMAERLDARAVTAGFSRLVVDYNRYPWDPSFIAPHVDGTDVPGNSGISPIERQRRLEEVFQPYHAKTQSLLREAVLNHGRPMLLSVHSMTPALRVNGQYRPWEISLCWASTNPLVEPLLRKLRQRGLAVGNNEPYSLDVGIDFTTCELALRRGLPHLQVEFRQDLISTRAAARIYGDHLADALIDLVEGEPQLMAERWPVLRCTGRQEVTWLERDL